MSINLFEKRWFFWCLIVLPVVVGLVGGTVGVLYQEGQPSRFLTWATISFTLSSMMAILLAIFEWAKIDRKTVLEEYDRAQKEFVQQAERRQTAFEKSAGQVMETFEAAAKQATQRFETEVRKLLQLPALYSEISSRFHDLKGGKELEFFGMVADKVLQGVRGDFRSMAEERRYTLRLITPTNEYVKNWVDLMAQLMSRGGEVVFVANAVIWSRKYLLAHGSSYSHAHKKELDVRRLLVVPSDEMLTSDPGLKAEILENLNLYKYHLGQVNTVHTTVHRADNETIYRAHFLFDGEQSDNFGIWRSDDFEACCLVRYREEPRGRYEIKSITFTLDRSEIEKKRYTFERLSRRSETLDDYIKHLEALGGGRFLGQRSAGAPQPPEPLPGIAEVIANLPP